MMKQQRAIQKYLTGANISLLYSYASMEGAVLAGKLAAECIAYENQKEVKEVKLNQDGLVKSYRLCINSIFR